ncbi:hypothetical protein [uncultured Roseibium sp.]|uniref:hypothetical protein n=1 Tax=uncultured Roseibium sp. TaxID=1936171 RepID=UPI00260FF46C|nr:hypothetical protein [uncultured Roseibium sp.]
MLTQKNRRDLRTWPEWLHQAWCAPNDKVGSLRPTDFPDSDGNDTLTLNVSSGEVVVDFGDIIATNTAGNLIVFSLTSLPGLYETKTLNIKTESQ